MVKKIDLTKTVIKNNVDILQCPLCKQNMSLCANSLLCKKEHCFDLSKNGYINLLNSSINSKYNKQLFTSRKIISQRGFFQKIIEEIGKIITNNLMTKQSAIIKVLDAGCGEGSNLVNVLKFLERKSGIRSVGVGVDISKEGIYIAANEYPGYIWFVADLSNIPIREKQCDFIINILSPANYSEFKRILKDDGLLIKVIPGKHYLREIRKTLYQPKERQSYTNEKVINLFKNNFKIISHKQLLYQQKIKQGNIIELIKMTPLSWSFKKEDFEIDGSKFSEITSITVDLIILSGKQK